MEGGISHLPLLEPSMRATPLSPSEWRKKLEAVNKIDESSSSTIVLDVRNGIHLPLFPADIIKLYLIVL